VVAVMTKPSLAREKFKEVMGRARFFNVPIVCSGRPRSRGFQRDHFAETAQQDAARAYRAEVVARCEPCTSNRPSDDARKSFDRR